MKLTIPIAVLFYKALFCRAPKTTLGMSLGFKKFLTVEEAREREV
jgi:hypothetical protein